jgi:anaerobic ribonucleoside-triphosphate reductase
MTRLIIAIFAGVTTSVAFELTVGWAITAWIGDRIDNETAFWACTIAMFSVPAATVAAIVAYRRPMPPDCCRKCGYDLTENESGTCPECGEVVQ